jgi:Ca2+-binding RTX toxin-like protein
MAVTTSYTLAFVRNLDLPSLSTRPPALTELAGGGFAGIVGPFANTGGHIFSSTGNVSSAITVPSIRGSLDQLTSGNLVVVSEDLDSTILISFVNSLSGVQIGGTIDLGDADSSDADVAALTGGRFVVVATDEIGAVGGDSDIDVFIRNFDGLAIGQFTIDLSLERDINPRVAALDNGNFAVTWERDVSGQSEIWYAVYDPTGATIKAPTILDTTGAINRNPDISAISGGFGIVYEDTDWDGDVDITLASFNSAGTFLAWANVTPGLEDTDDRTPSITRLSNGMLTVASGEYIGPVNAVDTRVALLNAGGTSILSTRYVTGGESATDNVGNVAVTGFGAGRIAVVHNNLTDSEVNGEVLSAVRVSESDAASDTITGDAMDDWMFGNDGNDILNGMGGDDRLFGGTGVNTLSGGDGNDTIYVEIGSTGTHVLGGNGYDTLSVSISVSSLGTISSIEALEFGFFSTLRLTGSQFATGFAANTAIYGNDCSLTVDMTAGVTFFSKFMTNSGVSVTVNGTTGNDVLKLGNFTHTVNAGDGADQIKGGSAVDVLNGDAGIDKLNGAAGADVLTGGTGNDVFKYAAAIDSGLGANADRITDFVIGSDRLNFARIDTNAGLAGDQGFGFIGAASFGGIGVAQIRYTNSGGNLLVQADVDGNGTADMEIILQGLAGGTLTSADFVL